MIKLEVIKPGIYELFPRWDYEICSNPTCRLECLIQNGMAYCHKCEAYNLLLWNLTEC